MSHVSDDWCAFAVLVTPIREFYEFTDFVPGRVPRHALDRRLDIPVRLVNDGQECPSYPRMKI